MVDILRMGEVNDWALALENFGKEIEISPYSTSSNILSTFGGIGSINDIVIYKNGQPLIDENREFDELRSRLYDLCHE
jgi:hypothetical protein